MYIPLFYHELTAERLRSKDFVVEKASGQLVIPCRKKHLSAVEVAFFCAFDLRYKRSDNTDRNPSGESGLLVNLNSMLEGIIAVRCFI